MNFPFCCITFLLLLPFAPVSHSKSIFAAIFSHIHLPGSFPYRHLHLRPLLYPHQKSDLRVLDSIWDVDLYSTAPCFTGMPKNLGASFVVRVFYTSPLALPTPMLCQLGSFLAGVVVGGTERSEICFLLWIFHLFFVTFVVLDSLLLHSGSCMAVTLLVASESLAMAGCFSGMDFRLFYLYRLFSVFRHLSVWFSTSHCLSWAVGWLCILL